MAATCTCQLWRCSHRSNVISEGCAFPLLWTVKWGRLLFSCQELSFYLSSMISDPCFPLCYFHLPPTPPRSPVIICVSQLLLFSPQLGQCQSLSRCLIGRCWILSITAAFPGCPDWEKVEERHPLCCNHRDQRVMCVSISFSSISFFSFVFNYPETSILIWGLSRRKQTQQMTGNAS